MGKPGARALRIEPVQRHRSQAAQLSALSGLGEETRFADARGPPKPQRAAVAQTKLFQTLREFMSTVDFLVLPVSQVPPFDVEVEWVHEIGGVEMETYIDWMKSCYLITVLEQPAISVPCGFTDDGLPVGIQIVGRHRDDLSVLQLAYAFQEATGIWRERPPVAS